MSQLNTKRLFVAVELPKDIREYLGRAILGLQKTGADAKWVEPKNIHLTLKFLGATPPETIPAICKAMTTAAENTPPWPTTLESFGGFPSLTAPRVLWISLADKEKRLERLVQKLDDSFSGIGLTQENRPFKAHITLARLRSCRNRLSLADAAQKFQAVMERPAFAIDNITLFESILSPKGPAYSVVEQIKLHA